MSDNDVTLGYGVCQRHFAGLTPLNISTGSEGGARILDSYAKGRLGMDKSLCCRLDGRTCKWFSYDIKASDEKWEVGAVGGDGVWSWENWKAVLLGLGVAGTVALLLRMMMVAALESATSPRPERDVVEEPLPAVAGGTTLREEREAQEHIIWEKGEWWQGLSSRDRALADHIVSEHGKAALADKAFASRFLAAGRVSEEGTRYLVSSRTDRSILRTREGLRYLSPEEAKAKAREGRARMEARPRSLALWRK